MRMSNLLRVEHERPCEMAASRPRVGIDHPTVVPGAAPPGNDPEATDAEATDTDGNDRN
jgi:hypothetical protein